MKVTRVEIMDLEMPAGVAAWHPVLVRVHTDEGLSGLGEVGLAYGIGHSAAAAKDSVPLSVCASRMGKRHVLLATRDGIHHDPITMPEQSHE